MTADTKVALVLALGCGMLVWSVLLFRMCRLLRERHPAKYQRMGRPLESWWRSARPGWPLLRFLVFREYNELADASLRALCRVLLILLASYLAGVCVLLRG